MADNLVEIFSLTSCSHRKTRFPLFQRFGNFVQIIHSKIKNKQAFIFINNLVPVVPNKIKIKSLGTDCKKN